MKTFGISHQYFRALTSRARQHFMTGLFVILLSALVSTFYFIGSVDNELEKALAESNQDSRIPLIYSAPVALKAGMGICREDVKKQLLLRGFKEVSKNTGTGTFEEGKEGDLVVIRKTLESEDEKFRIYFNVLKSGCTISDIRANDESLNYFELDPILIGQGLKDSTKSILHVPLSAMPPQLVHAVLAIEDIRFYKHFGVDPVAVLRAARENYRSGAIVQGGSTITQQLIKNLFQKDERSFVRKVREAIAALLLETRLTKNEILELYLNKVFFVQRGDIAYHGVSEAARIMFNKDVSSLSLSEAATLAGLLRAPSFYHPDKYPKRSKIRRDLVLQKMYQAGFITVNDLQTAKTSALVKGEYQFPDLQQEYFLREVRHSLRDVPEKQGELNVITSLNPAFQSCGISAVKEALKSLPKWERKGRREFGLVVLNPENGEVMAWVGGTNFRDGQFDHVRQAVRQVGSTIKPFIYLMAVDGSLKSENPFLPSTVLQDLPFSLKVGDKIYSPKNYDNRFYGEVTARFALERSLNLPALRLGQTVGVDKIAKFFSDLIPHGIAEAVPSLPLGTAGSSLLELTAAYTLFPNRGEVVGPQLIRSISNGSDEPLYSSHSRRRVASAEAAYILTSMLKGVVKKGTGMWARPKGFASDLAGKTGTSNDGRDNWFVGFTPEIVVGIWTGYDDNRPTSLTGSKIAAPTFRSFLSCAKPYLTDTTFKRPSTVVDASNQLPTFLEEEEPNYPAGFIHRNLTVAWARHQNPAKIVAVKAASSSEGAYDGIADNQVAYRYDSVSQRFSDVGDVSVEGEARASYRSIY